MVSRREDDHDSATAAFTAEMLRQYGAALHRFIVKRLRRAEGAQDVAQETYLRLLRIDDAEVVRQPQAYLYRIASNVMYELRLRERRLPVIFDSEVVEGLAERLPATGGGEPANHLSSEEELTVILMQLPPLYRAIIILRKRDGLSYEEIGRRLEISPHTVKKYLARAIALCRGASWDTQEHST